MNILEMFGDTRLKELTV